MRRQTKVGARLIRIALGRCRAASEVREEPLDTSDWSRRQGHRLLQLGILLFLFALLVGLVVPTLRCHVSACRHIYLG